jgi:SAM-dependent methyltransferase
MIDYDLVKYVRYEELPVADEAKKAMELQLVAELIDRVPNRGRALDIGTATGRYAAFLASAGFDVVGIDVSRDALLVASNKLRRAGLEHKVCLREMDATRLDFPEDSFDVVTCMMGTFCHIPNAEKSAVLDGIWQVLRPGGAVVVTLWNPECSFTNFLSIYDAEERAVLRANSHPAELLSQTMRSLRYSEVETHAICCFADDQLEKLDADENGGDHLSGLQSYIWTHLPRLEGQLYAAVGRKSGP